MNFVNGAGATIDEVEVIESLVMQFGEGADFEAWLCIKRTLEKANPCTDCVFIKDECGSCQNKKRKPKI